VLQVCCSASIINGNVHCIADLIENAVLKLT
jgi:hypothetical protein